MSNKDARRFLDVLPNTIKIGPHIWRFVRADQLEKPEEDGGGGAWGITNSHDFTISLSCRSPTKSFVVGLLLHELYHAALVSFGVTVPKKEEQAALHQETTLTTIFADNPWLLDWIKRGLK